MAKPRTDNTNFGTTSGWGVNWEHYVASGTYTVVANKECVLRSIVVNTTAAGAIIVRDNSKVIANLKASVAEGTYTYNLHCNKGLIVELAGASDVTVTFST